MSAGRFQSLLTQLPMPMAVLDDQLRFVEVNRWIVQLHGIPAEAFAGRSVGELLPGLISTIRPVVERALSSKETAQLEMSGQWLSSREPGRHWLISYIPIPERSEVLMVAAETTDRKRTEEALQRANADLMTKTAALQQADTLDEMCRLLRSTIGEVEAYWVIQGYMRRLFPMSGGALCVIEDNKSVLEVVASWGKTAVCQPFFNPDHCRALQNRHVYQVHDLGSSDACRHVIGGSGSAGICIPLQASMQTLGILHLRSTESGSFEESQLVLGNKVAADIALALASLKLQRAFRHQAQRDPLTGLYNRRYLEESLHRELRRSQRKSLSLGVMMVDIDHFKQLNDSEGHAGGDTVLQRLGQWIPSQVRAEDIVCRYGGDEFVLVLPDTSVEQLMKRAEELRRAIKEFTVHWQAGQLNVTASIGAAVFPDHATDIDELMKAADDALYSAKAAGRDRVEIPASCRQDDVRRIYQLSRCEKDLLSCRQAGKVLGRLAEFGSRICTQGYTDAVENLLPGDQRIGSPAETVTALAVSLTPNMPGLEGDLLRKALEETILEAAGLGYELHSLDIGFGLQNFLVRRTVPAFLELFLSVYVFDVVAYRMQAAVGLEVPAEASFTLSMLALERRCRHIVRSVSRDLGLNAKVDQLRSHTRLGATIMRAIEGRLISEEDSEARGRTPRPRDPKSPEKAGHPQHSVKRMNRIS